MYRSRLDHPIINVQTDAAANNVILNFLDMTALDPDGNTLTITGDSLDSVTFNSLGLSYTGGNSGGFDTYDFGSYVLRIDEDINTTFI